MLRVRKVVILGGGSAGMLAALTLAKRLPNLETVVIRSTKLGVIGVGEGTIATIGRFLHGYLGIDPLKFHQDVKPSIKLGIQFRWGGKTPFHYSFAPQFTAAPNVWVPLSHQRGYYCWDDASFAAMGSALMFNGNVATCNEFGEPDLPKRFAYHLENRNFVQFLEKAVSEAGVPTIDAIAEHVELGDQGISALRLDNGQLIEADLFIDCTGFRSELLGKALNEPFLSFGDALLCERALVGGWERTDEHYHAFTTAEAMDHGWSWQIEHDGIINRGYVFSSSFVSDERAEEEFREKNPRLGDVRMLKFRSGVYRRAWSKNVVAIGNSYGFVEPLEATAIGMICAASAELALLLEGGRDGIQNIHREMFNKTQDTSWHQIRDFLAMHYKPNQKDQTPFWDACRNDISLGDAQYIYDFYQATGPDLRALGFEMQNDIFGPEGYLSILVGQQLPYQRETRISDQERQAWSKFQNRLKQKAKNGVAMQDYLAMLRTGEASIPMATNETHF